MKEINILLVLGVILFIVVFSHLAQREQEKIKPLNPLLVDGMYQKPPFGLIWSNIKWALVSSQDKLNERPLIQRSSKSDKGRCNEPRSIDEILTVEFSGYLLEYPCTAVISGSSYTHLVHNKQPYKEFNLNLMASLGAPNDSIWRPSPKVYKGDEMSFLIYLKSDGSEIQVSPIIQQMTEAHKIGEIPAADLALYRDGATVVGFLLSEKDASNHSPAIKCILTNAKVEDYFGISNNLNGQHIRPCSTSWMLTKNIQVTVRSIKRQYAYHFKDFYQRVNSELLKTIKRVPEPNNQSYKNSKNELQQKLTDFGLNNESTLAYTSFSTEPKGT
ncbi:MAG: hypothetical protein L3J52_04280 [Proteobacteria bacterium]|nr:hypothetical protein [Pseudomonadota bacterium]